MGRAMSDVDANNQQTEQEFRNGQLQGTAMPEPVVIPINETNELRVFRDREWKGLDLVHVRRYYRDRGGEMAPTSRGITIVFRRLPELIQALQAVGNESAVP